jgi:hypothetical protein
MAKVMASVLLPQTLAEVAGALKRIANAVDIVSLGARNSRESGVRFVGSWGFWQG